MDSNPTDLPAWIKEQLANNRETEQIVREVCDKSSLDWQAAEELVETVQWECRQSAKKGRTPRAAWIALSAYLGGLLLLGYELYLLYTNLITVNDTGKIIWAEAQTVTAFWEEYATFYMTVTPLASAMIFGSLVGMRGVWKSLLFRSKD